MCSWSDFGSGQAGAVQQSYKLEGRCQRGLLPSSFRSPASPRPGCSRLTTGERATESGPMYLLADTAPSATPPGGPRLGCPRPENPNPACCRGGNRPKSGAGKWCRGPPASAPTLDSADQAFPALENPGRPQFGRPIASGGCAPGAHGSLARSSPPTHSEGEYGQGPERLAHSDSPRLPPSQGPWLRPLQRSNRSRQSCAVGIIFH
ncbi:hypothetical protein NDU88_004556 [Pleurodeles waltl]|uniref:Uncharacterized protein n=1 Tax=Pleurodeles waltl TaxID=8319 RepID=A0AAV7PCV3_PLEWA|nr:hypothetical protein NDU88_004556 [Pleurodeles waltl]